MQREAMRRRPGIVMDAAEVAVDPGAPPLPAPPGLDEQVVQLVIPVRFRV
jgi:hypothetical protein